MTVERTTQQSGIDRVGLQLTSNLRRLQDAQERLTSGKQIGKLSDDPAAVGNAVQLRTAIGRAGQYQRNISDGLARLNQTDSTLQQIVTDLTRVKDLATQAQNGAMSADDRAAIATELAQLKSSIAASANTQYLGQSLFGGAAGAAGAYDASGAFIGDNASVERNVAPGVKVAVNLNGTNVFETSGKTLFASLQSLIDEVNAGTSGTAASEIDAHLSTIQQGLSEVGGRVNRLEALKTHTDETIASMQKDLSSIEDIDLEKAMLDVQTRQVAYQAALAATARVIQPSLVDFLK